ncbi:hypothetical protein P7C73_g1368, partial [Tremellales sp. Uapishka_1]
MCAPIFSLRSPFADAQLQQLAGDAKGDYVQSASRNAADSRVSIIPFYRAGHAFLNACQIARRTEIDQEVANGLSKGHIYTKTASVTSQGGVSKKSPVPDSAGSPLLTRTSLPSANPPLPNPPPPPVSLVPASPILPAGFERFQETHSLISGDPIDALADELDSVVLETPKQAPWTFDLPAQERFEPDGASTPRPAVSQARGCKHWREHYEKNCRVYKGKGTRYLPKTASGLRPLLLVAAKDAFHRQSVFRSKESKHGSTRDVEFRTLFPTPFQRRHALESHPLRGTREMVPFTDETRAR